MDPKFVNTYFALQNPHNILNYTWINFISALCNSQTSRTLYLNCQCQQSEDRNVGMIKVEFSLNMRFLEKKL